VELRKKYEAAKKATDKKKLELEEAEAELKKKENLKRAAESKLKEVQRNITNNDNTLDKMIEDIEVVFKQKSRFIHYPKTLKEYEESKIKQPTQPFVSKVKPPPRQKDPNAPVVRKRTTAPSK
jgi:septal ring factor EnvC (AmiA/AmiB activator)